MILMKWLLLFYVIPGNGGLKEPLELRNFSVGEKIMKTILESCYGNDSSSNPIIIFGDFNEFIDESLIIRMDSSLIVDEDYEKHQLLNVGASKIFLIEDSPEKLQSDLMLLKKTRWWNHMAPFFLISKDKNNCEHFRDILITTGKMDMINSIYICSESIDTSALYVLNQIANYAPYPWERVKSADDSNIFRLVFNSTNSCENLNYDKTKYLNGHEIKAIGWEKGFEPKKNYYQNLANSTQIKMKVLRLIIETLNATCRYECEPNRDQVVRYLSIGTADLTNAMFNLGEYPKVSLLFPFFWTQVVAVTKSGPELSTLQKIIHLWRPSVLILALISLAIFTLVLALKNNDFTSGILDTTRLLTYVSIKKDSRHHSFRIFFTTILIMMIISNGVFQGKIAAFLTKREKVKPIETIDELIKLGYKLNTISQFHTLTKLRCPTCDIRIVNYTECINHVMNSTSNACAINKEYYQGLEASLPLEYVQESLSTAFFHQKCRNNWPIQNRVNQVLFRIVESGLFYFWHHERTHVQEHKRKINNIDANSARYQPVQFHKLKFAFQLLGIGLSLATIIFFAELLIELVKCSSL